MATHARILAWRIPIDRGAWRATVNGVEKSWTRLNRLSMHAKSRAFAVIKAPQGFPEGTPH